MPWIQKCTKITMHVTYRKTQRLKNSYIIYILSFTSTEVHVTCLYKFILEKSFETNLLILISYYATKCFLNLDIGNSAGCMTLKWMLIWINKRTIKIKILRVSIIISGGKALCYRHFTNLRTEKSNAYYLSVILYWLCKNRKRASAKFFFFSLCQFLWRHLRLRLGQKRRSEKHTIQTCTVATQIKSTLETLLSPQEYLRHFLNRNGYCYRLIRFAFT